MTDPCQDDRGPDAVTARGQINRMASQSMNHTTLDSPRRSNILRPNCLTTLCPTYQHPDYINNAFISRPEENFRSTVQTGKYPRVRLRKRIVCLDGRQRIAAARGKFGKRFWWPVKLYRDPHVSRFLHQTKYPDGEICWHLFRLALGKPDLGGDWRSELSKSKKKILNLLLRRENGAFKHKDIVAALCAVLEFPGARKGFKLGTMHKYTPLRCPVRKRRVHHHPIPCGFDDEEMVPHSEELPFAFDFGGFVPPRLKNWSTRFLKREALAVISASTFDKGRLVCSCGKGPPM
ncbi:hypothetical protein CIB48_g11946 [Xylaria polymorpha]|nr:hypothetical protein CIB48_g11946 [Xylaria polymorpha]